MEEAGGHDGDQRGRRVEKAGPRRHGQSEQHRREGRAQERRPGSAEEQPAGREPRTNPLAALSGERFEISPGLWHVAFVGGGERQVALVPGPRSGHANGQATVGLGRGRAPRSHVAALVEAALPAGPDVAARDRDGGTGRDRQPGRGRESDDPLLRPDLRRDDDVDRVSVLPDPGQDRLREDRQLREILGRAHRAARVVLTTGALSVRSSAQ